MTLAGFKSFLHHKALPCNQTTFWKKSTSIPEFSGIALIQKHRLSHSGNVSFNFLANVCAFESYKMPMLPMDVLPGKLGVNILRQTWTVLLNFIYNLVNTTE